MSDIRNKKGTPRGTKGDTVTVMVHTKAGKTRYAMPTVAPTDKTPADNSATDKVVVRH
jgi:hypothetical protein